MCTVTTPYSSYPECFCWFWETFLCSILFNQSGMSDHCKWQIFINLPVADVMNPLAHFVVVEAKVIKIKRTRTSKNLAWHWTGTANYLQLPSMKHAVERRMLVVIVRYCQCFTPNLAAGPAPLHQRHLGGSLENLRPCSTRTDTASQKTRGEFAVAKLKKCCIISCGIAWALSSESSIYLCMWGYICAYLDPWRHWIIMSSTIKTFHFDPLCLTIKQPWIPIFDST